MTTYERGQQRKPVKRMDEPEKGKGGKLSRTQRVPFYLICAKNSCTPYKQLPKKSLSIFLFQFVDRRPPTVCDALRSNNTSVLYAHKYFSETKHL